MLLSFIPTVYYKNKIEIKIVLIIVYVFLIHILQRFSEVTLHYKNKKYLIKFKGDLLRNSKNSLVKRVRVLLKYQNLINI